ncbi:hypothetical protein WJX75_004816 [Coccomyxa subellipsoidea]|uniref:Uncharacterized protein n=1 Tax=Coccomyxa subellipsoidea TaxID=248742 RepID=A0ABR2YXU9_9CHLO
MNNDARPKLGRNRWRTVTRDRLLAALMPIYGHHAATQSPRYFSTKVHTLVICVFEVHEQKRCTRVLLETWLGALILIDRRAPWSAQMVMSC